MKKLDILHEKLLAMQDTKYKVFQAQMLPMVAEEKLLGIKSKEITRFRKKFFDDKMTAAFMKQLPHEYFEENLIHIQMISEMDDYGKCLKAVKKFLPYIDNWAICDSLIPKVFAYYTDEFSKEIKKWLNSGSTYTIRFAILMLMKFYLDEDFDKKYLKWVAEVQTNNYYVEMMAAWFFTEALIKHYDDAIIFLNEKLLMPKIHTKTIQKAVDSLRVPDEHKEYLKSLRWRYLNGWLCND